MPSQKSNQSFKDNLYAVRYFISGQGLSLAVFKATRNDTIGPKTKHVDYLTTITHEPNVSIPKLIKYLSDRAHQPHWTVVFKSLIVIHHILNRGNQRFIQNLASSTGNDKLFAQMNSFNDIGSKLGLDMSTYLRRYARYLDSRIKAYRTLGVDFCRLKSDSARLPPKMKDMGHDELMLTIPSLQSQFDLVLKFDITMAELDNGIIDQAFLMLYSDLVKLYIAYQAAIIRVIELFLASNNLGQARELHEVYSCFLIRMDMVQDFMSVVESTGIKTEDFPRVSRVPNVKLETFKERLQQLERNKPNSSLQLNVPAIINSKNSHNNNLNTQSSKQSIHNNIYGNRTDNGQVGTRISLKTSKFHNHNQLVGPSGSTSKPMGPNNKIKICDNNLFKTPAENSHRRPGRRQRNTSMDDASHNATSTLLGLAARKLANDATPKAPVVTSASNNTGDDQFDSKYYEQSGINDGHSVSDSTQRNFGINNTINTFSQNIDLFDENYKNGSLHNGEVSLFGDAASVDKIDKTGQGQQNNPSSSTNGNTTTQTNLKHPEEQSDFDLMVIDSDSSSTSSETSVLNDACPYVKLDEKDLLDQVFPPVPELSKTLLNPNKPVEANPLNTISNSINQISATDPVHLQNGNSDDSESNKQKKYVLLV